MFVVGTVVCSRKPPVSIQQLLPSILLVLFLQFLDHKVDVFKVCQVSLFLEQGLVFLEFGQDV